MRTGRNWRLLNPNRAGESRVGAGLRGRARSAPAASPCAAAAPELPAAPARSGGQEHGWGKPASVGVSVKGSAGDLPGEEPH